MGNIQKEALLTVEELEQVSSLFRGKVGNAFARGLMRVLRVDDINDLYARNSGHKGPDFAASVIAQTCSGFRIEYKGEQIAPGGLSEILPQGAFITVSNHPIGHLDGISLVDIFGHLRPDYKVMVNRILARVRTLDGNFIPVTPVGNEKAVPTAASVSGIRSALKHLRSGGALGLFPSGAVSDYSLKGRCVRDREWQEAVIRLVMKAEVPVLPVRFFDGNSDFYYSLGLLDWRIRLLRLPAEVFNKKGRVLHIGVGPLISVEEQKKFGRDVRSLSDFLRSSVYGMHTNEQI